jgi:hypothetical protein
LPVDQRWVYLGKEKGDTIGLRITVLDQTEQLYSGSQAVTTRVVEEVEWFDANANGVVDAGETLVEISYNYFAQTQDGTVCYFGETVDIYENGVVVSHQGAWRADQPGNAPGIFMPADPQPGIAFHSEFAPGIAMDRVEITREGKVKVPAGPSRMRSTCVTPTRSTEAAARRSMRRPSASWSTGRSSSLATDLTESRSGEPGAGPAPHSRV